MKPLDPTPDKETPIERMAETAHAIAEQVIAEEVAPRAAREAERRIRPLTFLLMALLGVSLALHAITLSRLFEVRNTLRTEVASLADEVAQARTETLTYTLPIDQAIPIDVSVPVSDTFSFPINTSVRIDQEFTVPVETFLGTFEIPIPLDVEIPVSTTVPITFSQELALSTTLDLKLDVPITIDMSDPQISRMLQRIEETLRAFYERL